MSRLKMVHRFDQKLTEQITNVTQSLSIAEIADNKGQNISKDERADDNNYIDFIKSCINSDKYSMELISS